MQARFITASAIAMALAAATPAAAQELKYNFGGIEGAAAQPAAPDQVQTAPQANMPIFLELDGVPGETSEAPSSPPPPPPPSNGSMPMEQLSLNFSKFEGATEGAAGDVAAPQNPQAALLVPAVQRVREAAAASQNAPPTGETGLMPEMPICGHCGADQAATTDGLMIIRAQEEAAAAALPTGRRQHLPVRPTSEAAATEAAAEATPPAEERRRGRFSLSIGGVTLSSDGGVNVAVGDITGDGSGESSSRGSDRPASSSPPARGGSRR